MGWVLEHNSRPWPWQEIQRSFMNQVGEYIFGTAAFQDVESPDIQSQCWSHFHTKMKMIILYQMCVVAFTWQVRSYQSIKCSLELLPVIECIVKHRVAVRVLVFACCAAYVYNEMSPILYSHVSLSCFFFPNWWFYATSSSSDPPPPFFRLPMLSRVVYSGVMFRHSPPAQANISWRYFVARVYCCNPSSGYSCWAL